MKKSMIMACFTLLLLTMATLGIALASVLGEDPIRGVRLGRGFDAVSRQLASEIGLPELPRDPLSIESLLYLKENRQIDGEKLGRYGMSGRLLVPSAGIDVALFTDGIGDDEVEVRQQLCDDQDSAAFFTDGLGLLVADHNNQCFTTLPMVRPGDKAYVLRGHSIVTLECSFVRDGFNFGKGIVDEENYLMTNFADYVLYTCQEDWNHVLVCGFDVLREEYL